MTRDHEIKLAANDIRLVNDAHEIMRSKLLEGISEIRALAADMNEELRSRLIRDVTVTFDPDGKNSDILFSDGFRPSNILAQKFAADARHNAETEQQ